MIGGAPGMFRGRDLTGERPLGVLVGMAAFHIDPADGAIRFPDGAGLGVDTTQDAFLASPPGRDARPHDYGTRPWLHQRFTAGAVEGKSLLVNACFYEQMLVYVGITADLEPGKAKDWSNYSLDTEAATKRFHEALLEPMLGPPTERMSLGIDRFTREQATLAEPAAWAFAWGKVTSAHDLKGGGTSIVVSYGNRLEEANLAYGARRPR